jgi:tetratricopeptide (TPR) repeat protein
MSGKSSIAVAAATQLAAFTFPPEDSHLTHMPAHTFFDVGMYEAAFNVARRSVAMDYADFACCHPGYYSGPRYYHGHNVDFLLYASAQTGRFTEGVAAARRDGDPYFMAISLVAARDWPDVLRVPYEKGNQQDTLPFTRGLAYAKLGDAANAQRSLGEIADAAADSPDEAAMIEAMRLTLSGEIAELNHDSAKALADFTDASKSATKAQELAQAEFPALYYYSPHLALAELAVRLGKVDVAKAALQAELTASPASPEALRQMGQLASSH